MVPGCNGLGIFSESDEARFPGRSNVRRILIHMIGLSSFTLRPSRISFQMIIYFRIGDVPFRGVTDIRHVVGKPESTLKCRTNVLVSVYINNCHHHNRHPDKVKVVLFFSEPPLNTYF